MRDNGADFTCAEKADVPVGKTAFPQLASCFYPQITAMARKYTRGSSYFDDLIQEGLLGLYKAAMFYDSGRGVPFSAFANLCIRRQMINAAQRYQRYGAELFADAGKLPATLGCFKDDPESIFIDKEASALTMERLKEILSQYEFEVLSSFLKGESCAKIARRLRKPVKSVGNALTRGKQKLAKSFAAF